MCWFFTLFAKTAGRVPLVTPRLYQHTLPQEGPYLTPSDNVRSFFRLHVPFFSLSSSSCNRITSKAQNSSPSFDNNQFHENVFLRKKPLLRDCFYAFIIWFYRLSLGRLSFHFRWEYSSRFRSILKPRPIFPVSVKLAFSVVESMYIQCTLHNRNHYFSHFLGVRVRSREAFAYM